MKWLEYTLWLVGALLISIYLIAQTWAERDREQAVATFILAQSAVGAADQAAAVRTAEPAPESVATAAEGSAHEVLAVLRIRGVDLEVPVRYGSEETALRRGAGLIEGTAMPGSRGNVAIAAHRDTFFRGLKDLALGDQIQLITSLHTQTYRVADLSVVEPTDVHVLADTGEPVLTLVTCYPFYFVGNAPQRFIVRAVPDEVPM
jgi:sortase A